MSRAQLLAVADGLTLTGTITADPATLPAGLVRQPAVPAGDTANHPIRMADYARGAAAVTIQVEKEPGGVPATMFGASAGNRVVTVVGHVGQINGDNGTSDGIDSLQWSPSPGVLAEVIGNTVTDQQLQDFAATLTPATANDPRLSP